jgi:hypothetical protein
MGPDSNGKKVRRLGAVKGRLPLNNTKWAGKMKKTNRKVDLIIVITLVLIILAVILMTASSGRRKNNRLSDDASVTADDFNGLDIGVETGTHYGSVVKKRLPDAKVFLFDNFYDLIPALRSGQLDAFCSDSTHIDQLKKEIVMQCLIPETEHGTIHAPIQVQIVQSDTDGAITMALSYPGRTYNPFISGDELSVMIVRKIAGNIEYQYDEKKEINSLRIFL